jgi:hypothetical protein
MKLKVTCFFVLSCFLHASGQDTTGFFAETHYTGMSYRPQINRRPAVSSGTGFVLGLHPNERILFEASYEYVFIAETAVDIVSTTEYRTRGQLLSLRVGLGKTFPKAALHVLAGVGARFTDQVYARSAPESFDVNQVRNGISNIALDLGLRYRQQLLPHWHLSAAVYTNWMRPEDDRNGFYPSAAFMPFNSWLVLVGNVGVAYSPGVN